jgi:general secretion pathway protein M
MALVAEQGNNRLAAILLFVIAVIMIYLLCFHWFILRHLEFGTEISELSLQLGRFEQVAAQKAQYEKLLQDLDNRKSDENLFLEGGDFNQAEDNCQIVSRQPVRPRIQERFQKVTVNVRMRCGIEDLKKVLYSLESGVPMVIADEVTVIKPRTRRRANRPEIQAESVLDIRFNMSGYLGIGSES